MKRFYSVFLYCKTSEAYRNAVTFLFAKIRFSFSSMLFLFFKHTDFSFSENSYLPGNAFRHIRDFFRTKHYTIYNNTNIDN